MRSVARAAFLPSLVFAIGEGAIIPIIPVVAHNLGASIAEAASISGLIMVGKLIGDIPSGWITGRLGERMTMIYAACLAVLGLVVALLAPNTRVLALGILLVGLATSVFTLARHAFMTSYVPIVYRARALSALGGTFRLGYFIGPVISAGTIGMTGSAQSVFYIHIIACLIAGVILFKLPDPAAIFGSNHVKSSAVGAAAANGRQGHGLAHTLWSYRGVLVKLGSGAALIGAMRASRQVILPLWAVSIGLSDSNTALIIGLAGGVEFALFYAGGQIMDRFGRLSAALPAMIGLGVGHIVLAFTHGADAKVAWFISIAIVLSVANGIASGIRMTLGADLADKNDPAPFLGAWHFTGDFGSASAPIAISLLTAVGSIAVAAAAMGVVGLVGAALLARYVPRYIP